MDWCQRPSAVLISFKQNIISIIFFWGTLYMNLIYYLSKIKDSLVIIKILQCSYIILLLVFLVYFNKSTNVFIIIIFTLLAYFWPSIPGVGKPLDKWPTIAFKIWQRSGSSCRWMACFWRKNIIMGYLNICLNVNFKWTKEKKQIPPLILMLFSSLLKLLCKHWNNWSNIYT